MGFLKSMLGSFASSNPIGATISAGSSLLGGIFSNISQQKAMQESLLAQQRENQLNRDFNASEAQKQRDYNTQMIEQMQEYNSPKAMMQRLGDAGLNPNLVYGSIGSGNQSTIGSSSSASYSGGVSSTMPNPVGYSLIADAGKKFAETQLLQAQADNLRSNTTLNEIEASFLPQIRRGEITLQGVQINLGTKGAEITEPQKNEVAKRCGEIDMRIKDIQSTIDSRDIDNKIKREQLTSLILDNNFKSETFDLRTQQLADQVYMTHEEAKRFTQILLGDILLKRAQTNLANQQATTETEKQGLINRQAVNVGASTDEIRQRTSNLIAQFNNENKKGLILDLTAQGLVIQNRYGDAREIVGLVKDGVSCVTNIVSSIFPFTK